MIIYIQHEGGNIIECEVGKKVDNRLYFEVANGCWEGYFDLEQQVVRIEHTREVIKAQIVDCGIAKGEDYNERIDSVIEYIRVHGPISTTELRKYGCIPDVSEPSRRVKKRSKSNSIQTALQCGQCNKLKEALGWALDYIDAIPSDMAAKFPAMPGFDRDYVEGLIHESL